MAVDFPVLPYHNNTRRSKVFLSISIRSLTEFQPTNRDLSLSLSCKKQQKQQEEKKRFRIRSPGLGKKKVGFIYTASFRKKEFERNRKQSNQPTGFDENKYECFVFYSCRRWISASFSPLPWNIRRTILTVLADLDWSYSSSHRSFPPRSVIPS